MIRYFLITLFFLGITACKSKKILISFPETVTQATQNNSLSVNNLLKNHLETFPNFETLSGNISVDFKSGKSSQTIPLSFRIKRGEIILLNAPLGIAKAYLTPNKVQFYNKLDNTFFDGDYQITQHFLGILLNYQSIENLLLGQVLFNDIFQENSEKNELILTSENDKYSFQNKLNNHYRVDNSKFLLNNKQIIFTSTYTYQIIEKQPFPNTIQLTTTTKKDSISVNITLDNIEYNPKLNFPFAIPSGYKQLIINN